VKDISDNLLIKLAGERAFDRGQKYYYEGRVATLNQRGNKITALVDGTDTWQVTLRHTAAIFEGACDCPASDGFDFCKHCVAVALKYRESWVQENALANAPKDDRLSSYFMTWDKRELVNLSLELLENDPSRRNAFSIKADVAAGKMDHRAIKKQVTAAIPYNRHLFKYSQVRAYFAKVESVLETLDPLIKSLTPEKAQEIVTYGFERLERALETIDDSGGYRFGSMEILQALHFDALRRSSMPLRDIAEYLYELFLKPESDLYPQIPDEYLDILQEEGANHFLEIVRAEWDRLLPLKRNDSEKEYRYYHLMLPLLNEAKRRGDIGAEIELRTKIAHQFHHYLEISTLYLEIDQLDQALIWRRKAETCADDLSYSEYALQENQIAIWEHTGDYAAILDLRWEEFLSAPSLANYQAIIKMPNAGSVESIKDRALKELQHFESKERAYWGYKSSLNTRAEIYLCHEQNEDALSLAEEVKLSPELLQEIAISNPEHPDRTLPIYFELAVELVNQSKNSSYKEAISLLQSCRQKLPDRLGDSFGARISALRAEFKRKRNFIKWLAEAFPELF